MAAGIFRESKGIVPKDVGKFMAKIVCANAFKNWGDDVKIAEMIEAIKPCKENTRYMGIFESLLKSAPEDSKTAIALGVLIKNLKTYL